MLKVKRLTICGSEKTRYIDEAPYFGFALESDKKEALFQKVEQCLFLCF